jgi:hypothetical protein
MSKSASPEIWGVWSEANESPPEWFDTKSEAVDHAKNLVAENFGIKVHLLRAASVGTIEVPATPVMTGELTTKLPPASSGAG